jgi:hypothetical protein
VTSERIWNLFISQTTHLARIIFIVTDFLIGENNTTKKKDTSNNNTRVDTWRGGYGLTDNLSKS